MTDQHDNRDVQEIMNEIDARLAVIEAKLKGIEFAVEKIISNTTGLSYKVENIQRDVRRR